MCSVVAKSNVEGSTLVEHKISVDQGTGPLRQPPRRLSPEKDRKGEDQVRIGFDRVQSNQKGSLELPSGFLRARSTKAGNHASTIAG